MNSIIQLFSDFITKSSKSSQPSIILFSQHIDNLKENNILFLTLLTKLSQCLIDVTSLSSQFLSERERILERQYFKEVIKI